MKSIEVKSCDFFVCRYVSFLKSAAWALERKEDNLEMCKQGHFYGTSSIALF